MALTAQQVHQFYVGYYGRPADTAGLAYWQSQTEAAALAGFSASPEFTAQYASAVTTQAKVTQVYNNLLGRAPDAAGLAYWSGEITAGRETLGTLLLSVVKNALGKDVTTIADRVAYSTSFTAALDTLAEINAYNGTAATGLARTQMGSIVASVVGDHGTLTAATNNINATTTSIMNLGGQAFTLTTATTDSRTLTAGNDTVDGGTVLDSWNGDTIIDSSTTDTDVLNATVTGTVTPTVLANVETVNLTGKYGSAGLVGTGVSGLKNLVVDSATASGSATVTNAGTSSITSVKASTNISSLSVANSATGGAVAVDAGSANAVTVNGGAAADTFTVALAAGTGAASINGGAGTDTYTLNLKGGTLTLTEGDVVETLNLVTSTGAQTVNLLTNGATTTVVSGNQNTTLSGADTLFAGKTVTNSLAIGSTLTVALTGTAGTAVLTNVGANTFDLQGTGGAGSYTVANNANIKLNAASATTLTAAAGATAVNVDLANAAPGAITTAFETINATANSVDVTALIPAFGTTGTLNLSGSKNVTITAAGVAKAVNAANLTGVLTETGIGVAASLIANVTGGSGNDVLTLGNFDTATTIAGGAGNDTVNFGATNTGDVKLTLDGGSGTNTLVFGGTANLSDGTNDKTSVITNFQNINIGTNTVTLTQKQLFTNGNAFTVSGAGGTLAIVDDGASSKTFDLSGLQFAGGVTAPTITVSATGVTTAATITGPSVAASLTGGSAADTITGGVGADTIVGGAAADSLVGGAGNDTLSYSDVTAATSHSLTNLSGVAINMSGATVTAANVAAATQILAPASTVVIGGGAAVAGADLATGTAAYLATTAANSTVTMVRDTFSGFEAIAGSALKDVIYTGATAATVTGGAGADVITLGAANAVVDRVVQAAAGDSGTFALGATTTNTVSIAGFDVVRNFVAGDVLQLAGYTGTAAGTAANQVLVNTVSTASTVATTGGPTLADNSVIAIRGDIVNGNFVGSATGADLLVEYDGNATTATQAYEAIILVGGGALTVTVTAGTGGLLAFA